MELICFYFLRWISHLQLTVFAPVQMVWLWHGNQAEKREGDAQIDRETWRVLQSWCSLEVRGIVQRSQGQGERWHAGNMKHHEALFAKDHDHIDHTGENAVSLFPALVRSQQTGRFWNLSWSRRSQNSRVLFSRTDLAHLFLSGPPCRGPFGARRPWERKSAARIPRDNLDKAANISWPCLALLSIWWTDVRSG